MAARFRAQQLTSKLYRIGVLETVSATLNAANMDAFRKGLQELGYIEGKNYVVEYRSADGAAARFPKYAAESLGLRGRHNCNERDAGCTGGKGCDCRDFLW